MTERPISLMLVSPWVSDRGGGVSEAVRLLARLLVGQPGLRVEVTAVQDRGEERRLEGWADVRVSTCRYLGPGNYRFSPGLLFHLLRSNADLVHVHGIWSFQCLAVLVWALITGRPYIVSPHGMLDPWIVARSRTLKRLVSMLYQNAFLRGAAAFHVLTEQERKDVARVVPTATCHVIPNFVEEAPVNADRPAWWQPEFERKDLYLYLGRIHEKKGWGELCQAWEGLCAADHGFAEKCQLIFCGWIDGSEELEAVVNALHGRFGNVLFAGPQFGDDRARSLAAADAFILPSRSEGLPMVILEAWAMGLPVLMTRECNLPQGFEANAAVEIPLDADGIARSLKRFSGLDASARGQLSSAGLELFRREFSASRATAKFLRMYRAHGAVSPRQVSIVHRG